MVSFFSTREDELDHLLRNNVFVDLFKIVKQAFCIGAEGYGLKDIEPLYREDRVEEVMTPIIIAAAKEQGIK